MEYQLAQAVIDICALFLYPFAALLVISWLVSIFRYK